MISITPRISPATSRLEQTGLFGMADGALRASVTSQDEGSAQPAGTVVTLNPSPQRVQVTRCPTARPGSGGCRALQYGQVNVSALMRGSARRPPHRQALGRLRVDLLQRRRGPP